MKWLYMIFCFLSATSLRSMEQPPAFGTMGDVQTQAGGAPAVGVPVVEEAISLQGVDVPVITDIDQSLMKLNDNAIKQLYTNQAQELKKIAEGVKKIEDIRDTIENGVLEAGQKITEAIQSFEEELGRHQQLIAQEGDAR